MNDLPPRRTCLLLGIVGPAMVVAAFFWMTAGPLPAPSYASAADPARSRPARTESHAPGLENYDIRTDRKNSSERLAAIRGRANKNAADVADIRERFSSGERALGRRVASLKVEYDPATNSPEVVGADVRLGRPQPLAATAGRSRAETLRAFARENSDLFGVAAHDVDRLEVAADDVNPAGTLAVTSLRQKINGIPVFGGEIRAGFNRSGEMVRVINTLAAGVDASSVERNFGSAEAAVRSAAGHIGRELKPSDLVRRGRREAAAAAPGEGDLAEFGTDEWGPTAEKIYFPTEPGVVVPAWRVLLWQPTDAYYVIVDAATGEMLWRKNITEDQSQPATYNVFADQNAMIPVASSPFPLRPGPIDPTLGMQGSALARTLVTRVGNEPPYGFNNLGWISDGGTETDGNNVEAGLDRDVTNGVDTFNGRAVSPSRTFDFAFSPGNPNTNSGDSPVPAAEAVTPCASIAQPHGMNDAQRAAVTQLFYISNWFHDETYRLGFTEAAGNFQNDNFGRGGLAGDRISAEAQDCSGTNNANFATPLDGQRGRMQMYIWNGPDPDFDGDLDADIVIHELTHGLSNRLHFNSNGLSTNMARGLGEGWSDFYAHCLLSRPSDPIDGIYTIAGYATYRIQGTNFNANYYYGIRRFPKAVISATGGPFNRPFNPLTFADADATQFNIDNAAFPRNQFSGSFTVDQVHNLGEIWSSALWEVRARMVARLGWAVGNRKVLQIVTDAMKLSPANPTFLQARDAIVSAAQLSPLAPEASADTADVWAGFAARGMGASAQVLNPGSGSGDTRVVEAFDLPNLTQVLAITIGDAAGNNNGYPEPGETIAVSVPLTNVSGVTATGVTAQIGSGPTASYGTITSGSSVTLSLSYTVPASTTCGTTLDLTINVSSSLGATSFVRTIIVGTPSQISNENFDAAAAPSLPAGWIVMSEQSGTPFTVSTAASDTAPNAAFAPNPPTNIGGGTVLVAPPMTVAAQAATVTFRHSFQTEANWDGGVLEISMSGGSWQDIVAAGGRFLVGGYNASLGNGVNNPIAGRAAWTGNSGGFITTTALLPPAAAGQTVQLRWRFGADNNTGAVGWYVDTVRVVRGYQCGPAVPQARAPFDLDGDARTDVSIFRPASGEWWLQPSSGGAARAVQFGTSSDAIAAADFTGDRKTDIAFFRPSTGQWFVIRSEDSSFYAFPFGSNGDIPVPADYDGDGRADAAVFRPSTSTWYIARSTDGGVTTAAFGIAGDRPVAADYDGDGRADIAIFRPSGGSGGAEWWLLRSTAGLYAAGFGTSTDRAVPGDFTGDGKADIAFYRPSAGEWYVLRSEDSSFFAFPFGAAGDVAAPGDYDGDGKVDAAVYRPQVSQWYILRSSGGTAITSFGSTGDAPLPGAYVR
ncbi:MAG: M36 family metallopeptidase [Pyrinomonadaceae bacterium]